MSGQVRSGSRLGPASLGCQKQLHSESLCHKFWRSFKCSGMIGPFSQPAAANLANLIRNQGCEIEFANERLTSQSVLQRRGIWGTQMPISGLIVLLAGNTHNQDEISKVCIIYYSILIKRESLLLKRSS